jgi:hypothetical protein
MMSNSKPTLSELQFAADVLETVARRAEKEMGNGHLKASKLIAVIENTAGDLRVMSEMLDTGGDLEDADHTTILAMVDEFSNSDYPST